MLQYKATLVLGNGFDLSLKLDTSYKSFYQYLENNQFIEKNRSNRLVEKIEYYAKQEELTDNKIENWYDFEAIIKEYATSSKDARYLKKLRELKEVITEALQNQDIQNYTAIKFENVAKEFTRSKLTSLQKFNAFISEENDLDFDMADDFTKLCKQVLSDIDAIQKEHKHSADKIILDLKSNLQLFLKSTLHNKHIDYNDNPAIRILLALLGVKYQGGKPAVDELLNNYNNEIEEYEFRDNVKIISFNYTDTLVLISNMLERFGTALAINFDSLKNIYYPIHGTLKKENIIFGTDDCNNIPSEFLIFKKLEQAEDKNAKNNFLKMLHSSEIIVIYGHSINGIDFDYYKTFFQEYNGADIYVITYDEVSKEAIERVLRDNNVSISIKYLFTKSYSTAATSGFEGLLDKLIKQ